MTVVAGSLSTRERILRESAALFRRHGYNGTSMQDVAAAVGITKSSLYHHFPKKQALLLEILELTVDRVTPAVRAIAEAPLPAAERLRRAVAIHIVEAVRDQDNVACFIEEGRYLDASYRDGFVAKRDRYEGYFRRILADGIEAGEFRHHDVRRAALAILGMANSVVRWYRADGPDSPNTIASEFAELAVRSVAADGEGPAGGAHER